MKPGSILITGSGPAGLSLASELAGYGPITLISDSFTPKDDKTWCLWDLQTVPSEELIHHKWSTVSVHTREGGTIRSRTGESAYYCIRSATYQRYMLDKLTAGKAIQLVESSITGFDSSDERVHLHTEAGTIEGDILFQSHLRPSDDVTYHKDRVALKQHFLGWDIQCKQDMFQPDEAILMDFRVNQAHGFAFVYVLPFTRREALVEVTYFTEDLLPSRADYETELRAYLSSVWKLDDHSYHIEREEFGVIPMVDGHVSSSNTHPIYSIGLAGGHAKASTGYAFSRIHRDSKRMANALKNGMPLSRTPISPMRFRYYDLLMLYIIKNNPQHAVRIFETLFQKNGFGRMFQFLDEKTNFAQELRIMASVPSYMTYFKAMASTRHRVRTVVNAR